MFIPIHGVNDKVVDKPDFLWTKEEKRKLEINVKIMSFIIMFLDYIKFHCVHHFQTAKKMWDTLKMIYGVSLSIKQEKMNTWGEEDKDTTRKCFSKIGNIGKYVGNCITNKYPRFKNYKFNPKLKSRDRRLHEFQEKSRKKEIIENLNELVQLVKDEEVKNEESSTSSHSYHTSLVESLERTYSTFEWSSEDSTSNEGPSCS